MVFKCSLKFNLLFKIIPMFLKEVCGTTFWWKNKGGLSIICTLRKKVSSCACLVGSGLKLNFHWKAHSPIFFKSLFRLIFEASTIITTGKSEMSSGNYLRFDAELSEK